MFQGCYWGVKIQPDQPQFTIRAHATSFLLSRALEGLSLLFQQSGFCFIGDEAARRISNRSQGCCWVNVAFRGRRDFWLLGVFDARGEAFQPLGF